ncbi:MAG: PIN domain-containing protein [Bifidobacteriaceae bacterium]|jgi:predicted nucleic acid-binding protein|nr:PIN domain-containing protein [Bifidobacteriaceae bacterium]
MIALDASVLIAYLNGAHVHHARAVGIIKAGLPGELLIHSLTLAEVLVGAVAAGQETQVRQTLQAIGLRVADRPEDEAAQLARLRVTSKLKLPDCCVLATARQLGAWLATFDQKLASAARELGIKVAGDAHAETASPEADDVAAQTRPPG